jgi:hypothetical protein
MAALWLRCSAIGGARSKPPATSGMEAEKSACGESSVDVQGRARRLDRSVEVDGWLGGGADRVDTFMLHRLMSSSRCAVSDSCSITFPISSAPGKY